MKPKIKEIISDAFAVLCIGVGFAIHGILSLCFLIVGMICGAFALYFTLLNHRVHGATKEQARNWGIVFFVIFSLGAGEFWREWKQKATITSATTTILQPDYIEGTQFTRKQVKDAFPFGYAIIYYGTEKPTSYEIVPSDLMEWKIDLEKVVIKPNFFTGMVYWSLPTISGNGNNFSDITIGNTPIVCKLEAGIANRAPINFGNNPVLYVITLSANQLHPVFGIGYRIPEPWEKQKEIMTPPKL